jgi:hypothetical protein
LRRDLGIALPAALGAIPRTRDYAPHLGRDPERNRAWLGSFGTDYASYMMGETSVLLLSTGSSRCIDGRTSRAADRRQSGSPDA